MPTDKDHPAPWQLPPTRGMMNYVVEDRGYDTPCWVWQGQLSAAGYALLGGRRYITQLRARQAYMETNRVHLTPDQTIDHLCRVRSCVNPSHLEVVPQWINTRRAAKYSDKVVEIIRLGLHTNRQLHEMFGINPLYASKIRNGRRRQRMLPACLAELRLLTATAKPPSQAHNTDAGWDIYADIPEAAAGWLQVPAGEAAVVPTGIAMQVPVGWWYDLRGRSSTFSKHGLITVPGVIDSGYQGELKAVLFNPHRGPRRVEHHQRVAQLVLAPVVEVHYKIVDEFAPSERGERGWGSSGA